jgi:sulfur carrier protein
MRARKMRRVEIRVKQSYGRGMQLHVNGEARDVPDGLTVASLLQHLAINAPRVAVELNAEVVVKARHHDTKLSEGDRVEIVTFVGGG